MPKEPAKPGKESRSSAPSKKKPTGSSKQPSQATLAREADILSLLTVLNASAFADPALQDTLQAIKAALFARDYATAFSKPVRSKTTRCDYMTQETKNVARTTFEPIVLVGYPDGRWPIETSCSNSMLS